MYLQTCLAKFTSEILYFQPYKRLGENVNILLINADINQLDNNSLDHVSYVVVRSLDVLRSIVEHRICREFDTTLIVTMNHSGI